MMPTRVRLAGFSALLLIGALPLTAQTPARPVVLDSAAVERWIDGQVEPALRVSGIPGALVVVVQRSGTVLNKAYGLADIERRVPASAQTTLWQYASIGKTMTAVIAAQLIDEGVLDPDQDVNHYLKTARVRGPRVTLRMLLGHRGGFDDDITGLLAPFDGDVSVSDAELGRRLRPLVEPGVATAYDNQGFGVIGLVLRDVTGKSIADLYRERLFEPVGMTGAVQGRPADGRARLARCYTVKGPGVTEPCENWLYREAMRGAGGVLATGADMARYMRMLLNGGSIDGRTVLSQRAFQDLTNFDHYRFHPGMPGAGYAFTQFEEFRGLEYAHSGSMPGFSSMMKIYQDADVGILVTFIGGQPPGFDLTVSNVMASVQRMGMTDAARPGLRVMRELSDSFPARFIPAGRPRSSTAKATTAAAGADRLDDFLGTYVIGSNHSRTLVALLGGWGGLLSVERTPGGVRLAGIPGPGEYREAGPLLYENARGDRLAFAKLRTGRYMAVGLSGGVFKKTDPIESPAWAVYLFILALPVLLSGLVQLRRRAAGPIRALARANLVGFGLVMAGILAEWEWGVRLAVVDGAVAWPLLWRAALHAGAAVLVWSGVRFLRNRTTGPMSRISRGHGYLLAAAGWAVAVALVAWRVIGAFPPWFWW